MIPAGVAETKQESDGHTAYVDRVKAVDILAVVDGLDYALFGYVAGEGELDYESVDLRVAVERVNRLKQFLLGDVILKPDECGLESADLARLDLVGYISFGASVVSHKNCCEMRATFARSDHLVDLGSYLTFDVLGNFLSVDKCHVFYMAVLPAHSTHSAHHGHGVFDSCYLFHHLAGLVKLFDETVDLLDVCPRTTGYALAARAVDYLGMLTLFFCHRTDDCLDAFEGIVVNLDILQRFADTGNHRGELLEVAHLLNLTYLLEEIVKVELVLGYLALQLTGLFLVIGILGLLDQRHDVAHAENTVGHTRGVE